MNHLDQLNISATSIEVELGHWLTLRFFEAHLRMPLAGRPIFEFFVSLAFCTCQKRTLNHPKIGFGLPGNFLFAKGMVFVPCDISGFLTCICSYIRFGNSPKFNSSPLKSHNRLPTGSRIVFPSHHGFQGPNVKLQGCTPVDCVLPDCQIGEGLVLEAFPLVMITHSTFLRSSKAEKIGYITIFSFTCETKVSIQQIQKKLIFLIALDFHSVGVSECFSSGKTCFFCSSQRGPSLF